MLVGDFNAEEWEPCLSQEYINTMNTMNIFMNTMPRT